MSCRRVTLKGRFGLTAWLAGLVIGLGLTGARAQTLTWTGAGDFVTEVGAGNTTIGSGVTLNITTSADHLFPATALINNGTTNWSGGGSLRGWDGASFTNNNLFNDQNTTGAALYPTYNNNFVFTNASGGTYTKSGSATTTFSIGFTNDGIVNVLAGILSLAGGGTNTGSFVTGSGAATQFANDYSLATGSSLTGAGTYALNGGTLTASGGITVTKLDLNGGLLAGTQTFNTSTLNWIGSSLASGGTTTIASTSTLNILASADHFLNSRAIVNNGTTNWSGGGSLRGWDGASFTNNGQFNDQNTTGAAVYPTYNNNFTFTNASSGTYTKSGNGTTTYGISFTNDGIVNVQAGILSLAAGGTNTGSFVTSSGATTQFASDYSLATGSSLTGAGTYALNGGTLTASGGITVTKLDLNGGLLAGTQTFNTSTLNWIGSSLASGGTTTIASTSTLNILASADHFLNSRAIVNNGTTNWSGGGSLRGWDGASFTNNGQFNDQNTSGAAVYPTYNNNFTFTNASSGTYTKSGSATTIFSIGFNNAGTVNVQAGVFNLSGGGTNSGSFVTTSGAVTQFDADYILSAGSSLTGTGDYLLNAGSLAPDGNVTVSRLDLSGGALVGTQTFNNSTLNWTASSLGTSGATTIAGTSTFNILTSADHFLNSRAIVNNGTTNWSGGGSLRGWDGASFTNNGQFNDQNTSGAALYPTYNNNFTFTNASGGSYSKTGNSTTTFGMAFTNAGSIAVHAGTLVFNDTFANTNGSISLINNAALISASSIALGTGSLAGSGSLTAPSVSAGGVISPGAPVGQLNITSDLTLLGTALATFEIGGRSQGVTYDFLSVSGNATLNGTLALTFANGFQSSVLNTDTFAILSAASLAGTFANVINGGRLATLDGAGSFQVNYSGVGVSLSNFIAVPEPSTYSLLALGLAALARAARRRRRSPD